MKKPCIVCHRMTSPGESLVKESLKMAKTLIAYFSASGTTAHTAKEIAEAVISFATSGGSGIGRAEESLREHCPKANWKQGKLVNSGAGVWAKSVLGE